MIPIVTPEQMRVIDAAASDDVTTLIERAGAAVARAAIQMLGGTYGRRVVVLAGPGNNGADGLVAARRLARRGVQVDIVDARHAPPVLASCDLVIDAAYGTGFHGDWFAPDCAGTPVLAVDVPSGIDALTGRAGDGVLPADRTVTFAALKPGLLFSPASELAGSVEVADIGLDTSDATAWLVQGADVREWLPSRAADAHKWRSAVWVIAGSGGMRGAANLATRAAQRAGAGMVRLSSPGFGSDASTPTEAVGMSLPAVSWAAEALAEAERFHALVIGPGLGRADGTGENVRELVEKLPIPVVIDGDGLFALAWSPNGAVAVLRGRDAPTVLTPHDGEFALLRGERVGADRISAARRLADECGCVVLLKGSATVIAEPGGLAYVVTAGDARLATAGTGDVLAGICGALLAQQVPPAQAAAAAAWLHGRAAGRGPAIGLVAGDIPDLLPQVMSEL